MKLGTCGRKLRVGIIGLGERGTAQVRVICSMEDIDIIALCDQYEDRVRRAQDVCKECRGIFPEGTTDYHALLARGDIEAVVIMTGWQTHISIAVEAMEHGIIPGMEVGSASSVAECWNLVRTSEKTGVPCMLLENCCYNDVEMSLLRMIREGVFGELIHCRGGYQHDLRDEIGRGDVNRHYRQDHFLHRNAELYPTHELGPIAEYLNLNRGNRMLSLVSMSSKSAGEHLWLMKNRPDNPALQAAKFNQGDIVTTMISCANGETILLTHDCTLPRPYSRGGYVQGTKAIWEETADHIFIEDRSESHNWEKAYDFMQKEYSHPLWKEYREFGLRGGHGGMDYLVLRAFFESIQKGVPFPIDVYDAASWMAVTCLSEQSIAMGSAPVPVPDFTDGRWLNREKRPADMFSLDEITYAAFD